MSVDRASLLRERLGTGWSFMIEWFDSTKLWAVTAWAPHTEQHDVTIDASDKDLDVACASVRDQAKKKPIKGWSDAMKRFEEES